MFKSFFRQCLTNFILSCLCIKTNINEHTFGCAEKRKKPIKTLYIVFCKMFFGVGTRSFLQIKNPPFFENRGYVLCVFGCHFNGLLVACFNV